MGCSEGKSRDVEPQPARSESGPRLKVGDQEYMLVPAGESAARAAALLPTKPSEDMSHLLGKIDIPTARKPDTMKPEYLPHEKIDWVVTVEFPAQPRLDPKKVEELFDQKWRKKHGAFVSYGLDADSGRWTYAISADGPQAITRLKLAWDYVPFSDDAPAPTITLFEQRLSDVSRTLKNLGEANVTASAKAADAVRRAKQLRELKSSLDQSAVLILKAPPGRRFNGRTVWDVMLCLGLKWGDMDCFHWQNPTDEGDDSFFSVETSTPPGYFLPEEIAADRVHVEDLIFAFSIPRCRAPAQVFDAMTKAVQYSQERLQGTIQDETGLDANIGEIKKRIAEIEQRLRDAGFIPGADDTMRLF